MTNLFDSIDPKPTPEQRFREFHEANPHVYEVFCAFARRILERGFTHYSARTIWHAMRFHSDTKTTDTDFKLNNNYTPYYARMWMADHPEHDGFFETRSTVE